MEDFFLHLPSGFCPITIFHPPCCPFTCHESGSISLGFSLWNLTGPCFCLFPAAQKPRLHPPSLPCCFPLPPIPLPEQHSWARCGRSRSRSLGSSSSSTTCRLSVPGGLGGSGSSSGRFQVSVRHTDTSESP